jgi:HD-GYP domain-containing protein (c-di-GMP phosphodiesterase class II)
MRDIQAGVNDFFQAFEAKRGFVAAHARRVSAYSVRLATQYGLPPDVIESIRIGALLHDAGKLLVPVSILRKPGRLTEREWVELRAHPDKGIELVERIALDHCSRDIVLHHHERYDGKGYPDGLRGAEISWAARIVSVMDALDALTSPREYRARLSVEAACALICREAGKRFCPWVVSGLLSLPASALEADAAESRRPFYLPDGLPQPSAVHATRVWTCTPY